MFLGGIVHFKLEPKLHSTLEYNWCKNLLRFTIFLAICTYACVKLGKLNNKHI